MKKSITLGLLCLVAGIFSATAQVAINTDGSPPDGSAMLDVKSNSKGVLIPRMTKAQRNAIESPHTSLLVYQTDSPEGYYYYSDSSWVKMTKPCGESVFIASPWISWDGTTWVEHAGHNYHTILIGSQCWMKENLNVGNRIDAGTPMIDDSFTVKFCYMDDESYCGIYGGLYTWGEMMNWSNVEGAKGICPPGFHIPSDEDWRILESFTDSHFGPANSWIPSGSRGNDAGVKLKSNTNWLTVIASPYYKDDLTGFDAHGSGWYDPVYYLFYKELQTSAYFWTSSQTGEVFAWARRITDNAGTIVKDAYQKTRGYSVRCIKD
jgi:uncharacterized protein (TIGR02145 family)